MNYDEETDFAEEYGDVAVGHSGTPVTLRLRQHGAETGPVLSLREELL